MKKYTQFMMGKSGLESLPLKGTIYNQKVIFRKGEIISVNYSPSFHLKTLFQIGDVLKELSGRNSSGGDSSQLYSGALRKYLNQV